MVTAVRAPVREAEAERTEEATARGLELIAAEEAGVLGVMSRVPSASRYKSKEEPQFEHAEDCSAFSVRHCGQITLILLFPQAPKLWDYHSGVARLQP